MIWKLNLNLYFRGENDLICVLYSIVALVPSKKNSLLRHVVHASTEQFRMLARFLDHTYQLLLHLLISRKRRPFSSKSTMRPDQFRRPPELFPGLQRQQPEVEPWALAPPQFFGFAFGGPTQPPGFWSSSASPTLSSILSASANNIDWPNCLFSNP